MSHRSKLRLAIITLVSALVITAMPHRASADDPSVAEQEATQLEVLASDAPNSEKAIACKKLAIYGSDRAVPQLAKLLPNPQLSSWARIALEAIPGEASDKALRDACETLEGRLLVGTINSIGIRRDAKSVEQLTTRLRDNDAEVASAAAVALGSIGNDACRAALKQALASTEGSVRNAVAEGYVLVAERLQKDDQLEASIAIYDEIRSAELPKQRIVEATRGAILSRGKDGIPLLMETFRSSDKTLFQLALGTARELPGREVDTALADELTKTEPGRAALLVQAMADRGETVDLASILAAAQQGDAVVRASAINALQRVGDVSCLAALLQIATSEDSDLVQAANETLAVLPGEGVNEQIVALLPTSKGSTYRLLVELIGRRRIDAIPDLLKALNDSEASVRAAALTSLGETVPLDQLSILIQQVVNPKNAEDRDVAVVALKTASVRMPDQDACATVLSQALRESSTATKSSLLEIISEVGGSNALQTLADAAKSSNPELQDTGSRLLGKWNGVDAAPVLLDLAKSGPEGKYRIRALRGYIALVRKFAMPPKQRAEMCQKAMDASTRKNELVLVMDVLKIHPSVATLKLASAAKKNPAITTEAEAAIQAISQALRKKGVDVDKVLSGSK